MGACELFYKAHNIKRLYKKVDFITMFAPQSILVLVKGNVICYTSNWKCTGFKFTPTPHLHFIPVAARLWAVLVTLSRVARSILCWPEGTATDRAVTFAGAHLKVATTLRVTDLATVCQSLKEVSVILITSSLFKSGYVKWNKLKFWDDKIPHIFQDGQGTSKVMVHKKI